jgi:hypothetical protein
LKANRTQKQVGTAIVISDKTDLKSKLVKRDKKSHFILKKGTIHQEDRTAVNMYEPNVEHPIS